MVTYFLFGSLGHKDIGDEAYVHVLLSELRKSQQKSDFFILSHNPQDTIKRFRAFKVRSEYNFLFKKKSTSKIRNRINCIFSLLINLGSLFTYKFWKINIKNASITEEIKNSDIVIAPGGGLINEDYKKATYLYFVTLFIAKKLKKPILMLGQTVGPFYSKKFNILSKYFLNNINYITTRDKESLNYITKLGNLNTPVKMTADIAVLLENDNTFSLRTLEKLRNTSKPFVGCSFRDWFFPGSKNPEKDNEKYIKTVAFSLDYLIDKTQANVIFISTSYGDDDRNTAKKIMKMMKNKKSVILVKNELSAVQVKTLISRFDMFITTRLHPTIFATTSKVPTFNISYTFKCKEYMKSIGLEKYSKDINKLDNLSNIIFNLWINRLIVKKKLSEEIPKLKNRAKFNFKLIKNEISKHR